MVKYVYRATPEVLTEGQVPEYIPVDIMGRPFGVGGGDVISVTPTPDTGIYAADELLFNPATLTNAGAYVGGIVKLTSLLLLDEDDQGIAMDLLFLDASTSLGTFNTAFAASDTLMRAVVGRVNIATGDYIDFGGSRVAMKTGLSTIMKCGAATRDLYVAAVTRGGTPTYTATGLKFKFGIERL